MEGDAYEGGWCVGKVLWQVVTERVLQVKLRRELMVGWQLLL